MHRLGFSLFAMIAPTLAGVGAVLALVAGYVTGIAIILAAAFGFLSAIPASLWLARRLRG